MPYLFGLECKALKSRLDVIYPDSSHAGFGVDGLPLPPRPEALDEQRIDDLIAENLAVHKLEVLRQDELVRPALQFVPILPCNPPACAACKLQASWTTADACVAHQLLLHSLS